MFFANPSHFTRKQYPITRLGRDYACKKRSGKSTLSLAMALRKQYRHLADDKILYDSDGNRRSLTRREKIMFMNSHQIVPFEKKIVGEEPIPLDVNVDIFLGGIHRQSR